MRSMEGLSSAPTTAGPPTALDITSFPTIVEDILFLAIQEAFLNPEAAPFLHSLRCVSRSLRDTVDAKLAQHISLELAHETIYDAEFLAEVNALLAKPHLLMRGEEEPEFYRDRRGHKRRAVVAIFRRPRVQTSIGDPTSQPAQRIPGMRWGDGALAADQAECLRRLRDTESAVAAVDNDGYVPPLLRDRPLLHVLRDHIKCPVPESLCPPLSSTST